MAVRTIFFLCPEPCTGTISLILSVDSGYGSLWIVIVSAIALLAGGLGIAIWWLKRSRAGQYFLGYFEYQDEETTRPVRQIFDLARHKKKQITLGGQPACDIYLRGVYRIGILILSCPTEGKREIPLTDDTESHIQFKKQARPGHISHGDVFSIDSYYFHYIIR
ncbi:MAG: hypothetical protein OEZ36_04130 [Spirochaetota bacterium]|nr:hypothetical protein [Spirochaetota bacterium]